jgi:adenylate cyclase
VKKTLFLFLFLMPALLRAQSAAELNQSAEAQLRKIKADQSAGDKKAVAHAYGELADVYFSASKLPDGSPAAGAISGDKSANLEKSIEYANKSADLSSEIGDVDDLKEAYKTLYAAQKSAGQAKDAVSTYSKIMSLKHAILNPKQGKEFERRRLEYEFKKKEDSLRHQQQVAEERANQQSKVVDQQQQQLKASSQSLNAAQKEKSNVSAALQKTQTDLVVEKSESDEKSKQLDEAAEARALQAANLELQQNKIEMQNKALEQTKKEQYFYLAGLVVLLAFCLLIYRSFAAQKKFNAALVKEKKRSEELLLNILPEEVAGELIAKGFADAKHFYDVTVLFTDFVNFTTVAETMSPQQLVGELHICFKAFDMILSKYHIEKIKTVGDAYLAVSGLPLSNPNHASDIADAAIEIRDFMEKRKIEMGANTFGIRLGINSGNVVAGIVGVRKFAYDIWGDTVNIAARMEQNSEDGKINVSESTYQLIKDKYPFIHRGKIIAKNKGGIDMYYLG